jgi:hypothetical protein
LLLEEALVVADQMVVGKMDLALVVVLEVLFTLAL